MLAPILAVLGLMLPATAAGADDGAPSRTGGLQTCRTSVAGEALDLVYDPASPDLRDSQSLRARYFGGRGEITCPGLVTLRWLTPELTDADRAPFCLQWDGKSDSYIGYDLGARDGFLSCRTARAEFCQRVNRSKTAAAEWAGVAQNLALEAGTDTMLHSAGVISVKGPAALIGERLISLGAVAIGSAGAGPALGAMAVTAVAAGGAVYLCSDAGAGAAALEPAPAPKLRPGEIAPGMALPEDASVDLPGAIANPDLSSVPAD